MAGSMSRIAIIPARSGSKGLKDKNIKELCGKPLMAYTIEAAIQSKVFDCVHVSTDSKEYADIAKLYGADVPFLRDPEYAQDTTSTWDTVRHVLDKYAEQGQKFDMVTVLQPTSPLRTAEDIVAAYKLFKDRDAMSVVSVCEMEHCPLWCNTLGEDLSLNNFIDMNNSKRRQDIPVYYRVNGGIYMLNMDVLDDLQQLYASRSFAYIMDKKKSIDIDGYLDYIMAKTIMESL